MFFTEICPNCPTSSRDSFVRVRWWGRLQWSDISPHLIRWWFRLWECRGRSYLCWFCICSSPWKQARIVGTGGQGDIGTSGTGLTSTRNWNALAHKKLVHDHSPFVDILHQELQRTWMWWKSPLTLYLLSSPRLWTMLWFGQVKKWVKGAKGHFFNVYFSAPVGTRNFTFCRRVVLVSQAQKNIFLARRQWSPPRHYTY